jgi:hypothetical protein
LALKPYILRNIDAAEVKELIAKGFEDNSRWSA